MCVEPFPIQGGRGRRRSIRQAFARDHLDAINRARRYAQLAPGAECGNNRMHLLASTDDRIDRTRWQALGAANAGDFVDLRDQGGSLNSVGRIERQHAAMK